MDNIDLMVLDLFKRYLAWINDNNLIDTIDNYIVYFQQIEKIRFN